jgi:hypothetical protein
VSLKESMTVIQNYVETHMAEEARVYEFGHELYMSHEQKRAQDAERTLKDKLPHTKLRKYLSGHITCIDTLKPA